MLDISRRGFFGGLAAVLVAGTIPTVAPPTLAARVFPRIMLPQGEIGYILTQERFARCIFFICQQLAECAKLRPTEIERANILSNVDDCLDTIRPCAVRIDLRAPFDNLINGRFDIIEEWPGTIVIA